MLDRSRNILYSTGRVGRREDVKDSVLPESYWKAWKQWESTKEEIKNEASKVGVVWFVYEDEVLSQILKVSSGEEIAMAITYQEAKEHDTFKEGRGRKDEGKMAHFQKYKGQAMRVEPRV